MARVLHVIAYCMYRHIAYKVKTNRIVRQAIVMTINNTIFVDGHVHIYNCFALPELLDSAHRNFSEVAQRSGAGPGFTGVLMLTETRTDHWFQQMVPPSGNNSGEPSPNTIPWTISLLPDKRSLLAIRDTGETLYLIAGRQIVTAEGLEVLALATDRLFDDGKPIVELLATIREQGAIPVIPWAVGKWLGKRGKILSDVLDMAQGKDLFLGDNGGRPLFWKNISHFRQARAMGMPVLPGSDPLPFTSEASRIGSFGFQLKGMISDKQPATDISELIRKNETDIHTFGSLDTPLHFLINQARLRMPRPAA